MKPTTLLPLILLVWAIATGSAAGIAPPFVPDEELAVQPIIVVGKWNRAPLRKRSLTEEVEGVGRVFRGYEVHTELVVERVIKGNIKPGTHKILLASYIGWPNKDGAR